MHHTMERSSIAAAGKRLALLVLIAVGAGLVGCASSGYDRGDGLAGTVGHKVVRTYFATDRMLTHDPDPRKMFTEAGGEISYGVCEVSIPPDHDVGRLESPSVWRLEFKENPDRHVVLLETWVKPKNEFYAGLANRVAQSQGKNLLVFVHGYNVSFEDAARRTAQMANDLNFDGAPVFYSWPSKARESLYFVDRQTLERSTPRLKAFLADVFAQSNAENVYIVAHSMGNQGLTKALAELREEDPGIKSKLKELIIAAPDIDTAVFKEQIAPGLVAAAQNITLYASSRDVTMTLSHYFNGEYRLGDTRGGVPVIPGIETIDASNVDTDFYAHSYVGNSKSVVTDLSALIQTHARAAQRAKLKATKAKGGKYWTFEP